MGRAPCCDKANVKKGPWSPEEDAMLKAYIDKYGTGGNWIALPHKIGLKRCGKSCRLRWLNYLRPNIKHGGFSEEEDNIICNLYISIGSRWSIIAAQLPGRTDNDIKNYWNTRLKKKLFGRRKHTSMKAFALKDADVVDNVNQDHSSELSNSALERLQLHMQLQNPLSNFYNNPALWPKLHPLVQQRMIQSLQMLNLKTDGQFQRQSPQDHGPSIECANSSMSGSQSDNERPAADFYENMSFTSLSALHHDSLAVSTVKVDDPEPFYCNVIPENRSSPTLTSLIPHDYGMMMPQSFANTQVNELDNTMDMRRGGIMPQEEQIPQLDYFKESNHSFKDSLDWWSTNDLESRSGPSVSCDATSFLHCEGIY